MLPCEIYDEGQGWETMNANFLCVSYNEWQCWEWINSMFQCVRCNEGQGLKGPALTSGV